MRRHPLTFALGIALGLALAVTTASAGERPGGQLPLFLRLNGEWVRPVQSDRGMSDAGGLLLWLTDAGVAQVTVTGGQLYYLPGCDVAANICIYDGTTTMQGADGGCNNTMNDPNYGLPLAASTERYIVTQPNTTKLMAKPQSGATLNCPVFTLQ